MPYPTPQDSPAVARLFAQVEAIGREIREMRTTADRTLEQALKTNGRVTRHDLELHEMRIRNEERDKAAAHAEEEREHRRDRRDRWMLTFAAGSFTTILGTALAILAALIR